MNRFTRIAAVALSFAAAGSAFAESPLVFEQPARSTITTRAAVQAEVLQARAAGHALVTEADLNRSDVVAVARSREAVRAEAVAALSSADAQALGAEPAGFAGPYAPAKRFTVTTQLAQASR